MTRSEKIALKKLKEKAKFAKKSSGRRKPLPPNSVIVDTHKKQTEKNIWNSAIKELMENEEE